MAMKRTRYFYTIFFNYRYLAALYCLKLTDNFNFVGYNFFCYCTNYWHTNGILCSNKLWFTERPSSCYFCFNFLCYASFFTSPFLILIFALQLDLVPVSGWGGIFDKRIILPALTVGIPGAAVFVRLIRTSMIEVLDTDYIKLARAKGVSRNMVLWKHAFRNALLPVVTIMGFSLAGLFGGSLIVEILFGIPGIGRISLDSVYSRDYPVIMAIVLIGSSALVIANLIIDFIYTLIDPRIDME